MRLIAIALCLLGIYTVLPAQNAYNFWVPIGQENIKLPENAQRTIRPNACKTYRLAYADLWAALQQAPAEYSGQQPLLLDLPQADGTVRRFRVWESSVMAPELQAKYPGLRSYAGSAADGSPGMNVRLGIGPKGFYGFFLDAEGHIQTVRPYADSMTGVYMAYRLEDLPDALNTPEGQAVCGVDEVPLYTPAGLSTPPAASRRSAAPVTVKKYRMAVAAQAEYSLFHGGTKNSVLNAIQEALDFIVLIQERDFAMRLELIPNNDTLIYFDPDTDPYSGQFVSSWRVQNVAPTNSRVGLANYDFGHVFARVNPGSGIYVAGQACLACICTDSKAAAGSSLPSPVGEGYYLIIAHEMGHQLSATHTFNNCPSSQDAQTASTAFEPGAGSTIMSYAAVCGGVDVYQNNRDGYYHVANLEQITKFIAQEEGSTCGLDVDPGNTAPEVSIPLTNGFYIPISTPFALSAEATDPDGDNLTYCWEEYDLGPVRTLGDPILTTPIFRSYKSTANPTRTFPRIQTIVNNGNDLAEYLPDYNRQLNFKVSVRDNSPGGGGLAISSQLSFNATIQAGPFVVTSPNTSQLTWHPGEYQTVEWDVANTDKAPVNCRKVNIKLSVDGGLTYPHTLASGVPNQGRYCIQVPAVNTAGARIRVEAADNIFFDISNSTFQIVQPTAARFTLCPAQTFDTVCLPAAYTAVIHTAATMGFSDPLTLSVEGLPAGATAAFAPDPVLPGNDAVMTLNFLPGQPNTSFDAKIKASAGASVDSTLSSLTIYNFDFSALSMQAPADGAAGQDRAPVLRWNGVSNAASYDVEVATSPTFVAGTLVSSKTGITADSFKIPTLLDKGQVFYWRFRPKNGCGPGDWLGPFAFATLVDVCAAFESSDLPKNITSAAAITVESKLTIPAGGVISDLNITKVQGFHEYFQDLEMRLVSPAGTEVLLFKNKCPNFNGNFNFGFDDSKPALFGCPPPNNGVTYKPTETLSAFNGQNAGGQWILRVKDTQVSSGGSLQAFHLEFCSSTALNPPVLVNNNPLVLDPGVNAVIAPDLLKTTDPNNSDDQLVYTLMTTPANGELQLYWGGALQVGAQFTQADLNGNGLRYFDYGHNAGNDAFCFSVTDNEGGLIKDCFAVQPLAVGVRETLRALQFTLAPNPASESVRIAFGEAPRSDTRIRMFDAAGQLLHTQVLGSGQATAVLQVAQLPEGLYTIAVDNAEGGGVRKLVVR
ncbi:MAG: proprotein convertase P-domain-containing protein [Saprospirales bacterium]|nr:proprotein convertase P-domain-containing protein [Saprospirales bacterium]